MNKKSSLFEECEFLELTDTELESVSGGRCRDYPDDSNYYADSSSQYDSTSSGFLNIPVLSQNNVLNDFSIF